MKVTLEENYRKYYTFDDLDRAKYVMQQCKEYWDDGKDWAKMAAETANGGCVNRIIEWAAHTAKNANLRHHHKENFYGGDDFDTEDMDVYVDFLAETWDGFIRGGAYLSDIVDGGDYKWKMYYQVFKMTETN